MLEKQEEYLYQGGGVHLKFSFAIGKDNVKHKTAFLGHLENAVTDLKVELGIIKAPAKPVKKAKK